MAKLSTSCGFTKGFSGCFVLINKWRSRVQCLTWNPTLHVIRVRWWEKFPDSAKNQSRVKMLPNSTKQMLKNCKIFFGKFRQIWSHYWRTWMHSIKFFNLAVQTVVKFFDLFRIALTVVRRWNHLEHNNNNLLLTFPNCKC